MGVQRNGLRGGEGVLRSRRGRSRAGGWVLEVEMEIGTRTTHNGPHNNNKRSVRPGGGGLTPHPEGAAPPPGVHNNIVDKEEMRLKSAPEATLQVPFSIGSSP